MPRLTMYLIVLIFLVAATSLSLAQDGKDNIALQGRFVVQCQPPKESPERIISMENQGPGNVVFKGFEGGTLGLDSRTRTIQQSEVRDSIETPIFSDLHIAVGFGLALPVGSFASSKDGAAKLGLTLGIDYAWPIHEGVEWVLQFNFVYTPVDEEAMRSILGLKEFPSTTVSASAWLTYLPVTGPRIVEPISSTTTLFCSACVGALIGTSPEVVIATPGATIRQESATAMSFGYSLSVGVELGRLFRFDARYISGRPKYEAAFDGYELFGTVDFQNSHSVILFEAGIEL